MSIDLITSPRTLADRSHPFLLQLRTATACTLGILWILSLSSLASVGLYGTALVNPLGADGTPLVGNQLALLVVDRSRDGFAVERDHGIHVNDDLSVFVGDPDDVIVAVHASVLFGNMVLISGGAIIDLENGIDEGDPFAIVYFDGLAAESTTVTEVAHYGLVSDPTWTLPKRGSTRDYTMSANTNELAQRTEAQAITRVSVSPRSLGYDAWRALEFGSVSSPQGAPSADPDTDTFSNFFEYAFGTDPQRTTIKLPATIAVEGGLLYAEYRRPQNRDGAEIVIEVSQDLANWQRGDNVTQVESSEVIDGEERVRFRSLSGTQQRLFMRIGAEFRAVEN